MAWKQGFDAAKAASQYGVAPRRSRQVGAALFSGSTLVAIGFNRYNYTHPKAKWGIHAEHSALIKRQYHPSPNLIMYVYRESANGKPAMCKPCENCHLLMREAGVRFVRYINNVGDLEQSMI
jgi:cytidine deaminase